MELKIEKGVPVPPVSRENNLTQTFKRLEVGDSVLLPLNTAYNSALQSARQSGGRYTLRTLPDGIRIWRIK